MSAHTHTPGPWKVWENPIAWNPAILDSAGNTIATASAPSHERAVANARLIASAPDLLAERDALRAQNATLRAALEGLLALNQPEYEANIARAAIAKATGGDK